MAICRRLRFEVQWNVKSFEKKPFLFTYQTSSLEVVIKMWFSLNYIGLSVVDEENEIKAKSAIKSPTTN